MIVLELINALSPLYDKTLDVIGVLPSGVELEITCMGNDFDGTKVILGVTNIKLTRLNPEYSSSEVFRSLHGFVNKKKEVLLSFDERHKDNSLTVHYYPIEKIEMTENTFRLVARDELLDLRVEEPPIED